MLNRCRCFISFKYNSILTKNVGCQDNPFGIEFLVEQIAVEAAINVLMGQKLGSNVSLYLKKRRVILFGLYVVNEWVFFRTILFGGGNTIRRRKSIGISFGSQSTGQVNGNNETKIVTVVAEFQFA